MTQAAETSTTTTTEQATVPENVPTENTTTAPSAVWVRGALSNLSSEQDVTLQEFRKVWSAKPKLASDTNTLLRFLVARSFNLEESKLMLENHLKWRKETYPIKKVDFQDEVMYKVGAITTHGLDKDGSPVLILRNCLFNPKERDLDRVMKFALYLLTYMLDKHNHEVQFTILYDRDNFSLSKHKDLELIKNLSAVMSDNFPETLKKALISPTGAVFRGLWAIAKYYFDPKTRKKLLMLPSTADFGKHVEPEHLHKRYNGLADHDLEKQYAQFPEEVGVQDPWA